MNNHQSVIKYGGFKSDVCHKLILTEQIMLEELKSSASPVVLRNYKKYENIADYLLIPNKLLNFADGKK